MEERRIILEKLEEIGFNTDYVQFPDNWEDETSVYKEIYKNTDYPVDNLGILTPMFKSLSIEISAAIYNQPQLKQTLFIEIYYNYKHHNGGFNGHTIGLKYDTLSKKWKYK